MYLFFKLFHHQFALQIVLSFFSSSSSSSSPYFFFVSITNCVFLVVVRSHVSISKMNIYSRWNVDCRSSCLSIDQCETGNKLNQIFPFVVCCQFWSKIEYIIWWTWARVFFLMEDERTQCFNLTNVSQLDFVIDSSKQWNISIAIFKSCTCATLLKSKHNNIWKNLYFAPKMARIFECNWICIRWLCTIQWIFSQTVHDFSKFNEK